MTDDAVAKKKGMITRAVDQHGYPVKEWREGDEGLEAALGRFRVTVDDDDQGLYEGDEGEVTACVVGAPEYENERVSFSFTSDEMESGMPVHLDQVEGI